MSETPAPEPFGSMHAYRFAPPRHAARPTKWARRWRLRWFSECGTVVEQHPTRDLVCMFSESAAPAQRRALLDELAAHRRGVGQVLAACRESSRRQDRLLLAGMDKHP